MIPMLFSYSASYGDITKDIHFKNAYLNHYGQFSNSNKNVNVTVHKEDGSTFTASSLSNIGYEYVTGPNHICFNSYANTLDSMQMTFKGKQYSSDTYLSGSAVLFPIVCAQTDDIPSLVLIGTKKNSNMAYTIASASCTIYNNQFWVVSNRSGNSVNISQIDGPVQYSDAIPLMTRSFAISNSSVVGLYGKYVVVWAKTQNIGIYDIESDRFIQYAVNSSAIAPSYCAFSTSDGSVYYVTEYGVMAFQNTALHGEYQSYRIHDCIYLLSITPIYIKLSLKDGTKETVTPKRMSSAIQTDVSSGSLTVIPYNNDNMIITNAYIILLNDNSYVNVCTIKSDKIDKSSFTIDVNYITALSTLTSYRYISGQYAQDPPLYGACYDDIISLLLK